MIAALGLPEPVARCVDPGSAPEPLRLAVAAGAIPLAPGERLCSLTALLADPSAAVRGAARSAWDGLPIAFFEEALRDASLPGMVLDRMAELGGGDASLVIRVLEHPRVGTDTLARFVTSEDEEVLSRVAQNQRLLAAAEELLRRLVANPHLHPAERSRLASLLHEPVEPEGPEAAELQDAPLPRGLPRELLDDVEPGAGEEPKNLYQFVQTLKVAEKVKLASLGSKSARRLLIRDNNKVVASAVIRSPKIQEDEVQAIVQDRTVADEVIRIVLQRKDWLKNYPIRLALCQNPKTPIPKALRLLETLQDRDLRQISKSRNVPSGISAGATRILARRGKL